MEIGSATRGGGEGVVMILVPLSLCLDSLSLCEPTRVPCNSPYEKLKHCRGGGGGGGEGVVARKDVLPFKYLYLPQ